MLIVKCAFFKQTTLLISSQERDDLTSSGTYMYGWTEWKTNYRPNNLQSAKKVGLDITHLLSIIISNAICVKIINYICSQSMRTYVCTTLLNGTLMLYCILQTCKSVFYLYYLLTTCTYVDNGMQ